MNNKFGLDPVVLESVYEWVDSIPLSRPKVNIARDFSDGGISFKISKYIYILICAYVNFKF